MTSITINVNDEVTKKFAEASDEQRKKYELLLDLQLQGVLTKPKRSLEEIMRSMSRHAQANGLTPEILESILNDGDDDE